MSIQQPVVNQDEEHLRLLAMFHYVVAGMIGLFAMFPIFHLAAGLFLIFGSKYFKGPGGPPPAFLGWFFVIFALVFILLGLTLAILILINGRCIAKRKHFTFCQVMACVECMLMPFGTVLGVFTLVVLARPTVKPLFGLGPAAP
jgi:hypothetical protein